MVDVQRLARGLVDECSRTGGASRYLDSTTDALVVRALAQAQARRRHLPVRVGVTDGFVVATLEPHVAAPHVAEPHVAEPEEPLRD